MALALSCRFCNSFRRIMGHFCPFSTGFPERRPVLSTLLGRASQAYFCYPDLSQSFWRCHNGLGRSLQEKVKNWVKYLQHFVDFGASEPKRLTVLENGALTLLFLSSKKLLGAPPESLNCPSWLLSSYWPAPGQWNLALASIRGSKLRTDADVNV